MVAVIILLCFQWWNFKILCLTGDNKWKSRKIQFEFTADYFFEINATTNGRMQLACHSLHPSTMQNEDLKETVELRSATEEVSIEEITAERLSLEALADWVTAKTMVAEEVRTLFDNCPPRYKPLVEKILDSMEKEIDQIVLQITLAELAEASGGMRTAINKIRGLLNNGTT